MRPLLETSPQGALLELSEVKLHCRIDGAQEDSLLESLIASATAHLDGYNGYLGRCLIDQTWSVSMSGFSRAVCLPFPDVSAATVTYFDKDGVEQTVSGADHYLLQNSSNSTLEFDEGFDFPAVQAGKRHPVKIEFVVGFGATASSVPAAIKQAALQIIAHWYDNRETVAAGKSPMAGSVEDLLRPWRIVRV